MSSLCLLLREMVFTLLLVSSCESVMFRSSGEMLLLMYLYYIYLFTLFMILWCFWPEVRCEKLAFFERVQYLYLSRHNTFGSTKCSDLKDYPIRIHEYTETASWSQSELLRNFPTKVVIRRTRVQEIVLLHGTHCDTYFYVIVKLETVFNSYEAVLLSGNSTDRYFLSNMDYEN